MIYPDFVEVLRTAAQQLPEKTAFTYLKDGEIEETQITYQGLVNKAQAIAASLQERGISPGERALLIYSPSIDFISAFFGCLFAGVIAVPAYPPLTAEFAASLKAIAADAQPKAYLSTQGLLDTFKQQAQQLEPQSAMLDIKQLPWLITDTISPQQANAWKPVQLSADTIAFLQYTSGSTGTPKGVMVSHGNLLFDLQMLRQSSQYTEDDVCICWLPTYHDLGLIANILQSVYSRFSVYIMSPMAFIQQPYRWLKAISRYKGTMSGGPNFAYELCVHKITQEQKAQLDLSAWRQAFVGAEPTRPSTIKNFSQAFAECGFNPKAFFPSYGLAEATVYVSGSFINEHLSIRSIDEKALHDKRFAPFDETVLDKLTLVSGGQPVPNQPVAIVNPDTLLACQQGEVGEIWVSGPGVGRGYWARPELTTQVFQAHLLTGQGPYLRTGDLGYVHQGELFIIGRVKDVIIIRGRNYYPQDIEFTMENSHRQIRPGRIVAFATEVDNNERLVVAAEIKELVDENEKEQILGSIRDAIIQRHGLRPYSVLLVPDKSIKKTTSGKIRRQAMRELYNKNRLTIVASWIDNYTPLSEPNAGMTSSVAVTGQRSAKEIEQWIANWIVQRLHIKPTDIQLTGTFAQHGMDSMTAVTLLGDLQAWLGKSFDATLAWNFPTITSLAQHLETANAQASQQHGANNNLEELSVEQMAKLLKNELTA